MAFINDKYGKISTKLSLTIEKSVWRKEREKEGGNQPALGGDPNHWGKIGLLNGYWRKQGDMMAQLQNVPTSEFQKVSQVFLLFSFCERWTVASNDWWPKAQNGYLCKMREEITQRE